MVKFRIFGRWNNVRSFTILWALPWALLVILAASICMPVYSQASFKSLIADLQNPSEKTLANLESISSSDPDFKLAIEETLKILYSKEDWPRFFAYAKFYRSHWDDKARGQIQLLEPIALLRHCQDQVLLQLLQFLKTHSVYASELGQIEALAQTRFKGKASQSGELNPLKSHFDGKTLWKTNSKEAKEVHPRQLSVKVENLCGS